MSGKRLRMLNPKAFINFKNNYRYFIRKKVEAQVFEYFKRPEILLSDWLNERIFLTIVNKKDKVLLFFGNIKHNKSPYILPVERKGRDYPAIHTDNFENLPKEYVELLYNHRVIKNGKKRARTTLSRLIVASKFDLHNREVHHINGNVQDNRLQNLSPEKDAFHDFIHSEKYRICNYFPINFDNRKSKLMDNKRKYTSKYKDDRTLFIICYYKYIKKYTAQQISELLIRNMPSQRTIEGIVPDYYGFNEYFLKLMADIQDELYIFRD